MNIKNTFLIFVFAIFSGLVLGQPTQSDPSTHVKLDGIAAVVGNEIVLESDIERDFIQAKAEGLIVENRCEFLENILVDKLLLTKAKEDTLVQVTDDQVSRQVESRIGGFLSRYSEQEILDGFGMATMAELKEELGVATRDYIYSQQKTGLITDGIDATPEQVYQFYEEFKSELPDIPEEVGMSHIVIYPEIKPEHEQEVIDQLNQYKKEVEEGSSFSTKAILYSDDPGSKSNGGLINKVKRGMMVPEFDAVVFNLEEGQISEPFKTEFGYHIATVEKRRGNELDIRHILIQMKPTAEEWELTRQKLSEIINKIDKGEMTFKEAALQYSVDKYTKYNAGKLMDLNSEEDRFDRSKLPAKYKTAIAGLNAGDVSDPFENDFNNQPVMEVLRLDEVIPAHKVNLEEDYSRLKRFTINTLRQEEVMSWVKDEINDTFIKVGSEYDDCEFRMDWRKE